MRINSQNNTLDSLNQLYKNSKYDTTKIRIKINIAEQIYLQKPDSALKIFQYTELECLSKLKNKSNSNPETLAFKKLCAYSQTNQGILLSQLSLMNDAKIKIFESINVFKEINDSLGMLVSFVNISEVYSGLGLFDSSIFYNQKVINLSKRFNSPKFLQIALNNIGVNYDYKGDIAESLKYYFLALEQTIHSKEFNGQAQLYHNIAGIYLTQGNNNKALEYFNKSIVIREKIGDKNGMALTYSSIGRVYKALDDNSNAIRYFEKAESLFKELGDLAGLASVYNNMGSMFRKAENYKKAEWYLSEAIKIGEQINDVIGLSHFYVNISVVYKAQKQIKKAIYYAEKSIEISKAVGIKENIQKASKELFELYKETNNFEKSLYYHELFIQTGDTINNIENQKSAIKQQTEFEYKQKKIIAETEHKLQLSQQKEKAKQTQLVQFFIIGFVTVLLIVVFIFSAILFKRFKLIKNQNYIIEQQKNIVEEKQKEILDSIKYARRIQQAMLPTNSFLAQKIKRP